MVKTPTDLKELWMTMTVTVTNIEHYRNADGGRPTMTCSAADGTDAVTLTVDGAPGQCQPTTVEISYQSVDRLICQLQYWAARQPN